MELLYIKDKISHSHFRVVKQPGAPSASTFSLSICSTRPLTVGSDPKLDQSLLIPEWMTMTLVDMFLSLHPFISKVHRKQRTKEWKKGQGKKVKYLKAVGTWPDILLLHFNTGESLISCQDVSGKRFCCLVLPFHHLFMMSFKQTVRKVGAASRENLKEMPTEISNMHLKHNAVEVLSQIGSFSRTAALIWCSSSAARQASGFNKTWVLIRWRF